MTVDVAGTPTELRVAGNVGDALTAAQVTPDEDDIVTPAADTALADGLGISYTNVEQRTTTKEVSVPFEKKEEKYHLKKMSLKDGTITGVEDLGEIKKEPLSSDGTNVYYILDTNGKIGCYDGTAATSFDVKGIRTIRTIYGDKNAYVCGDFV